MKRLAVMGVVIALFLYSCFRDAVRPSSGLYPATALLFLSVIGVGILGLTLIFSQRTPIRLRLFSLFLVLSPLILTPAVEQWGHAQRQARFDEDRIRLEALRTQAIAGELAHNKSEKLILPKAYQNLALTAKLTGSPPHRQFTVVVAGTFVGFLAYIWCEDGKPPSEADAYSVPSATPRGGQWYEAWVPNGH